MYDPHRLRRNDRRYFSRKGQVIQAKAINPPFTIETNKVEAYKEYILQNKLISFPAPPPAPPPAPTTIILDSIEIVNENINVDEIINFSTFEYINGTLNFEVNNSNTILILITQSNDKYDLSLRVVKSNQSFPFTGWAQTFETFDGTWTDRFDIWFQSDGQRYFNIILLDTEQESTSDIQISKSYYEIPLPAPSG